MLYTVMNNRMCRLLLVIMTLALVVSPLRGALAFPILSAVDDADHCAQMQEDEHSMEQMTGMQDSTAGNPDTACELGCGGDCCDGACGTCLHGSMILSDILVGISDARDHSVIKVSDNFSGRTAHPPFRPHIPLLS